MRPRTRLLMILAFVAFFILLALPVLASVVTDPPPPEVIDQGPTTAAVIAGLVTFGLIVKQAVAATKKAWVTMTGLATIAVASAYGTILAAAFDFQAAAALAEKYELTGVVGRVPDGPAGWLISGIAIMAVSGFAAELAGTSGPRSQLAKVIEVDAAGNPV